MNAIWPNVPLGEVLVPVVREHTVDPGAEYSLLGIRLDGQGPFHRETVLGAHTSASRLYQVKTGDFIYSRLFAWRGAFGLIEPDLDGHFVSNEFPTFAPKDVRIDLRYLRYWFRLPHVLRRVEADCSGSTPLTRNRYKEQFFFSLQIALPPLDEQRRIVARIEELAAKIGEASRLRRECADEVHAITSAHTTKLFASLDAYPQIEISRLGLNGDNPIQIGPFGAQLHASEFVPEGVPVLNVGNVWPTGLRLDSLDYVTPKKAAALARYTIKADDLLFARSGATLGKVCLVPPNCEGWLMTGHLFRVRFDPSVIDKRFAFAGLRGARQIHDQVFGQVRGATRPGYNTTLLGAVKLPLLPLIEQHRIVAELDALQAKVDSVKALQAETAAELDAMLPAILDKAFKGELV
jgi:type I restriction enzyme S subunit